MRIKTLATTFILNFACLLVGFGQNTVQPSVLAAGGGRFVFGQPSSSKADHYVLDTETGRLWIMMLDKNGKQVLEPITYRTLDGKRFLFPQHPEVETGRGTPMLRELEKDAKGKTEEKTPPKETKSAK